VDISYLMLMHIMPLNIKHLILRGTEVRNPGSPVKQLSIYVAIITPSVEAV